MKIKIEGFDKLQKKIETDKMKILGLVTQGLLKSAYAVEGEAANYPFKRPTGQLSAHYRHLVLDPLSIALFNDVVSGGARYWVYVEYGTGIYATLGSGRQTPWTYYVSSGPWKGFHRTRGQPPKFMLTNALNKNKARIKEIIQNEVLRGLINGS